MNNKKMLMVVIGETYRHDRHSRGTKESRTLQQKATQSHLDFINSVKERLNIETDIYLYVYTMNDEWDREFIESYDDSVKHINVMQAGRIGEAALQSSCLKSLKGEKIGLDGYDCILFIRPDLFLKQYFGDIFTAPEDQIKFAHVNEIISSEDTCGGDKANTLGDLKCPVPSDADLSLPAVCHQIFYVPKQFYDLLLQEKLWKKHLSFYESYKHLEKNQISFFIDSFHSSCTGITWNPIYCQVSRDWHRQCELFPDDGWVFDYESLSPKFTGEKMYTDLSRKKPYV